MTNLDSPSGKATLLRSLLANHVGREKGISAKQIAAFFDWTERDVRKHVSELRQHGDAICAHPATGYFIAETPEEIKQSTSFLRSRAMHTLTLISRIEKISLPTLLGQFNLKT